MNKLLLLALIFSLASCAEEPVEPLKPDGGVPVCTTSCLEELPFELNQQVGLKVYREMFDKCVLACECTYDRMCGEP